MSNWIDTVSIVAVVTFIIDLIEAFWNVIPAESLVSTLSISINTSVTLILNLISTCINWNIASVMKMSSVIILLTSFTGTISSINITIVDNWVTMILNLSYGQVIVDTFVAFSVNIFATEFDVRVTRLEILRFVVFCSAFVTDLVSLAYTVGNCDIVWCTDLAVRFGMVTSLTVKTDIVKVFITV